MSIAGSQGVKREWVKGIQTVSGLEYLANVTFYRTARRYHYIVILLRCFFFTSYLDRVGLFCEILVQRPLMKRSTLFLASKLTQEDLDHMRKVASDHFDQIMEVLKAMPRQLLLIIRCVCAVMKHCVTGNFSTG